jgi:hypothetical protein
MSREQLRNVRNVSFVSLAVLSMFAIAIWGTWISSSQARTSSGMGMVAYAPTASELETALMRTGITPEALAAAGLNAGQVTTLVSNVRGFLTSNPTALTGADADYSEVKPTKDRLERKVESGRATQEEIADYQNAVQALQGAKMTRRSALNAVFSAAIEDLPDDRVITLTIIRANIMDNGWANYPMQYLVRSDRTQAQWVELREALDNAYVSDKYNEAPDDAMQTVLANEHANMAVSLASTNLRTNLTTVTTAWENAISN